MNNNDLWMALMKKLKGAEINIKMGDEKGKGEIIIRGDFLELLNVVGVILQKEEYESARNSLSNNL